jgi:hypothetical protein
MKLTASTIYINYVNSFDIKWYELQVELTDHMVNSMEEIWRKIGIDLSSGEAVC